MTHTNPETEVDGEFPPRLVRRYLYLTLAVANAVVGGLAISHTIDPAIGLTIANLANVFGFSLATSKT